MSFQMPKPELPNPWPFDQPPDCVSVTTTHVMHGGQAITHVSHDEEDHGWQFHYPGEKSMADALLVALKTIYLHDPTIADVADLPPGWTATREDIGKPWTRTKD